MGTPPPPGLIPVALGKGCLLLLTAPEFERALARGKVYRRRVALAERCGQSSEYRSDGAATVGDKPQCASSRP